MDQELTYELTNLHDTRRVAAEGGSGLRDFTRKLIMGETLAFARRSYPDEFQLHLGDPVSRLGPKDRLLVSGSFVISSVGPLLPGSPRAHRNPTTSMTEDRLDVLLGSIGGLVIAGVEVFPHLFGFALSISFSDGSVVMIVPTPDGGDPALPPLPDWEMFTPYKRYLRVGPGPGWAYLPSDERKIPSSQAQVEMAPSQSPSPTRKTRRSRPELVK